MITVTMTDEAAELLLDILAESQFPLMSDQTKVAEELYCAVGGALDEATEDFDELEDDEFPNEEFLEGEEYKGVVCGHCGNPVEDTLKRHFCDYCGNYLGISFRV